jgi:two-component system, NtrC family, sensor histidine kinase HydH
MSIRLRFTITLTVLGLILFGGYAVLAYRGEQHDLHTATEREIRMLGRSLATSLGNDLRDRQRADVDETIRTFETLEPVIHLHVHDVDAHEIAHSKGVADDPSIEAQIRRAVSANTELLVFDDDVHRVSYAAPLTADDNSIIGAVAITRSTEDLEADLGRTRWRLIAVVVGFGVVTLAAGVLLGTFYVKRPLATVLEGISHVRDGDFRSRVPLARDDEIGALVGEFNRMVAALADAHLRIEQETDARLRLERGLRDVDKMVTIGQLSAGLAHEIGSPLHVVSGRAQALLERSTDPEARRQAQILIDQAERITKIVEQLLSFGRRRPAVIARCDFAQPVKTVLELLASEAKRRRVDLRLELAGDDLVVDADADQLQQVVLNLVKNALASTPANGTIVVRVEAAPDEIRLVVRDTGPGIPTEMQPKLFEPFFTTRAAEGGTGLGLAVVRAITLEHGGSVAVTSEPGHGAEFVARFPRREARAPVAAGVHA